MEKEEENPSKLPASLAGDHWSMLPDLALCSISMRLPNPKDFTALCDVCQSWRSAMSPSSFTADFVSSITADFVSSTPRLVLLFPRSNPSAAASFYSLADDAIFDCPSIPSFQTLGFFGQSNGYLIGLDKSTDSIPSIADPISGLRVDFPIPPEPIFRFAILTAPPTSPKSQLVLFQLDSLLFCPIGGSKWTTLHHLPAFKDAIFFQDRLYLTHHDDTMSVRVVEYDLETKAKREIFYGKCGLLVESSEGELLMVFIEQEMLVGFKLLPRTEMGLDDNGGTDWPRGGERSLFLGWQRSDFSSNCLKGSIPRKYIIHPTIPFWRNYLASSQLRPSGFYVDVDAHGIVEVSMTRPDWPSFQRILLRMP